MKKILFSFILFFIAVPSVYAAPATLSFDPVEIKTAKDQTFNVNVNIFTGNEPVASADIVITYDPAVMQPLPEQTVNKNLFQTVEAKIISPGRLYIYAIDQQKNNIDPARGTVASIAFKTLSEGDSSLHVECEENGQNTSQIIKFNSNFENIINCTSTRTHSTVVHINSSSILGAYTNNYAGLNNFTLLLGSMVVIFSCYIIVKYQRLHKDIS